MDAARFLSRVAEHPDDLRELRSLAADLAHESERQPIEVLAEIRRGLARVEPRTEGARAYLLALRDLLSGVESARAAAAAAAERRETAEVKRSWHPILALLREQPRRPSDVASELGVDKAQVSRELKAMRAAELVEVYAAPGEDARSRHHRLTPDGRAVAEKLAQRAHGAERTARAVISFVTQVYMLLHANRRLAAFDATARAKGMLEGTRLDPRWTCDLVAAEAERNGLFRDRDGVWFPGLDPHRPKRHLRRRLSDAARQGALPELLGPVVARAPAGVPVVVRSSSALEGAWRSCAGALSAAQGSPRIVVITDGEMALGDAAGTPGSLLFYDSLRQLHADLAARPAAVARLAEPATYKACFIDAPQELLPPEFEPVRLA